MSTLLKCAFERFWAILVAVISGVYTLLITVTVLNGERLNTIITPVIIFSITFLIIVFLLILLLVKLNLLTCKIQTT